MRVVCTEYSNGRAYRVYRCGADFLPEMRELIPFLWRCNAELTIGGGDDDPDVVLTITSLSGACEQELQARVERYLV